MKNNKEQKVQQIFDSISGISPTEIPPYFYTRLRARMEREQSLEKTFFLARPAFFISSLCIILAVNIIFLMSQKHMEKPAGHPGIESFAAAYGLENKSVYE